jgi:hypothetical protein
MAAFAYELQAARVVNDSETQFGTDTEWQVVGASSYSDAATALAAVLPTTFTMPDSRIAYLSSVVARELRSDEFFQFAVGYASQPPAAVDEEEYEFSVSAQTEKIYQSIATTAFNPSGKSTPNFGGAIGLATGEPQGVEPLSAFSTFSITKHWALSAIDLTYQGIIESLVGSVCSDALFKGRAAGTVRFMGASGRRQGDKFPISYQFGFRPNVSAFTVDAITVTSANGWDIIDPYYEFNEDATAKKVTRRARCVYVHQIHPLAAWAALAL